MKKIKSFICLALIFVTLFTTVSITAFAKTVVDLPKPTGVTVTSTLWDVRMSWNDMGTNLPHKYLVYRSDTGKAGTWKKIATLKAGKTEITDKNVKLGETYFYTVKCYYKDPGTSVVHLSEMSGKHKIKVMHARPTFISVENTGKGVKMIWSKMGDSTGYIVYRSLEGKAGTWTKIATIKNADATSYTDSKITFGETYYYCFKKYSTINGKNYYSQSSKAAKIEVPGIAVPRNLLAYYRDGEAIISFYRVDDAQGYVIYRSDSGKAGTWSRVLVTDNNKDTEFIDNTIEYGKIYYYTVKAYKVLNGKKVYSKPVKQVKLTPEIINRNGEYVQFWNYYDTEIAEFRINGIAEDDLRIFIDGIELTEDLLNDEKALSDFMKDRCFFIYDIVSTDDLYDFELIRLKPGKGTLKLQNRKYEDIYAEVEIRVPEFEYDKDIVVVIEHVFSGLEHVENTKTLLEESYDSKTGKVIDENKVESATEHLKSAKDDFTSANDILAKYESEYKMIEGYQTDVELVNKYFDLVTECYDILENEYPNSKTITDAIEKLNSIEDSISEVIE